MLEIGAGRGANFGSLPPTVSWVGVVPSARRRAALVRVTGEARVVLDGRAERLPIPDESVDAVLSTIVLCSVRDQAVALLEVGRVLRPGGTFVFFEHVAPPAGTWSHRVLRVAAPVTRLCDHGCDPTRRTVEALRSAALSDLRVRRFELRTGLGIRVPYIGGHARR